MMLPLIIVGFALAFGLAAVTTVAEVGHRSDARNSLKALGDYQVNIVRERDMLESFGTRVLLPFADSLGQKVKKYTPAGYNESIGRKIMLAGNPVGYHVDRIIMLKALGLVSGVVWYPLVFMFLKLEGLLGLLAFAVMWVGSFMLPEIRLDRTIADRQHQIARQLPDLLDLLVISVEAGLGFEQALDRTSNAVPGHLSDEFRRMLQETRLGSGRADALRALDERTDVPELRSFIMALLQADTFGVSVGRILRSQADEMRIRRRLSAQEMAQKTPVKMLFPLVTCIFPAVFVIVLGPALITIVNTL